MSLRFFSDQCVPLIVTEALRNAGYEAIALSAVLPIRAKDSVVIAKAGTLPPPVVKLE